MPEIQYPKNPNSDTAFVVQEDGTKNRALMTAPQDTSTLELPSNPNSTKGYVTIDGKKQRVVLTADIGGGGGDQHNLGYYTTQAALEEAYPTAEAGDWAIVGATDTVWIWDEDTSAWVDSDQKGQVTSVNGQTGAVVLDAEDVLPSQTGYSGRVLGTDGFVAGWVVPEKIQRDALPQASQDEVGNIYQFTGTTDANYTNGYFYQCVSDGQDPATYSWTRVDVQASSGGLPSQTGQSGKFLTTDGTDASWSDKPLVNKAANGTDGLAILGASYNTTKSVVVGKSASTGIANGSYSVLVGYMATASQNNGVAIGARAATGAVGAIQIGSQNPSSSATTNSDANTFKVANANGNFELMNANGNLPADRLASTTGLADGNYRLRLVMASGVPTLEWVAE